MLVKASPIYRVHRFTVLTDLPCSPIYRAHRFTVSTDLPCSNACPPMSPVNQLLTVLSTTYNSIIQ